MDRSYERISRRRREKVRSRVPKLGGKFREREEREKERARAGGRERNKREEFNISHGYTGRPSLATLENEKRSGQR